MSKTVRSLQRLLPRILHGCRTRRTGVCGVRAAHVTDPSSTVTVTGLGFGFRQASTSTDGTSFTPRTALCGRLSGSDVGRTVQLSGWLQGRRHDTFLLMRDWQGTVQLVLTDDKKQEFNGLLKSLQLESVLEVSGTVRMRPEGQRNMKMATGEIEVVIEDLKVLNLCKPQLPFDSKGFQQVKESLRMEHRYLDLRSARLQRNLRLRSRMVMKMRHFLADMHDFVEVETPTLFRRTPGGAKEFIVPSHIPGQFYSLPQSPQQFKQLLMVGGLDRYFQIARCYRDEGAKPDRQPEFTQVDIEMSFVESEGVMGLIEGMLGHAWPPEHGDVKPPFPRMSYVQCMAQYGCDKPDRRFEWKLQDVTEVFKSHQIPSFGDTNFNVSTVQALCIPDGCTRFSNKEIQELPLHGKEYAASNMRLVSSKVKDGQLGGPIAKQLDQGGCERLTAGITLSGDDLVFLAAGQRYDPHSVLSRIRLRAAAMMEAKGVAVRDKDRLDFLWVTDFPLFLPREDGESGLESAHHPFTAPVPEDADLVYTHPEQVRGQHYDLVLNGQEIGGGSIRIHCPRLQRYVLTDVLQEDCSQLEHLLTALDSGCPPHGGIALGLDRLLAIVCGAASIRDVIAFPKSSDGKDPMSRAPAPVPKEDLDSYHIAVKSK